MDSLHMAVVSEAALLDDALSRLIIIRVLKLNYTKRSRYLHSSGMQQNAGRGVVLLGNSLPAGGVTTSVICLKIICFQNGSDATTTHNTFAPIFQQ
jgi:hypothetical protein